MYSVESFNSKFEIGQDVYYENDTGDFVRMKTISTAFQLGDPETGLKKCD